MDTEQERKLERLRRIPIAGGLLFMLAGSSVLFLAGIPNQTKIIVIACLMIACGAFLSGIGAASIKMRRWVFSVEDRIKKLEDVAQNRHSNE